MQAIEQIKPENYRKIKPLYENFRDRALTDYKYQSVPIDFESFTLAVDSKNLEGLVLLEDGEPEGILIYSRLKSPGSTVIEVNAVHSDKKAPLLQALINRGEFDRISYPMLGIQENSVKALSPLGFKFVGQSIVKFDFQDPVSYRVLKNSPDAPFGESRLSVWDEKYREQTVELINLAFKNTKNANFDPRFLTKKGSEDVLEMILTNRYGSFLPFQGRLLLRDETLEGFCLAVMATEDKINIPLIALRKDERNKGMGKLLLKSVIGGFAKLIGEKNFHFKEINATVDTDNYPAINMYRRLGFREEYFYPHAYLNKAT